MPSIRALSLASLLLPTLALADQKKCKTIDVLFLVDISNSMNEELEETKMAAFSIAETMQRQYQNPRIGLALYETDYYSQIPLTSDHTSFLSALYKVNSTFGGIENAGMAIQRALTEEPWRTDALHLIVLLTDEIAEEKERFREYVPVSHASLIGVIGYDFFATQEQRKEVIDYWGRQEFNDVFPLQYGGKLGPLIIKSIAQQCQLYSQRPRTLFPSKKGKKT